MGKEIANESNKRSEYQARGHQVHQNVMRVQKELAFFRTELLS